jgi:hypothetical protein
MPSRNCTDPRRQLGAIQDLAVEVSLRSTCPMGRLR